ncbi:hypothetical protein B5S28_g2158 [[Candida] boidinii]|nr:hypothetical protein B5S28_g2158 [[Candida] boidinii]OWB72904.1 hypothetical protein B5S31_g2629 [[Candida] boidinii]OWB78431.1 hypothetical protein B5S32_g2625 [[Candida] boidinii]
MSFYDVLKRGDDFLLESRPESSRIWNIFSHATCAFIVAGSKVLLNTFYDPKVVGLSNLDEALERSRKENRGLITVMNHMSVVDDPFLWACLPWRYFRSVDDIRWGLAASNICFSTPGSSRFFSLGKIISCERFGRGPFQGGIDACIRILSPDDTLDIDYMFHPSENEKINSKSVSSYFSVSNEVKNWFPFLFHKNNSSSIKSTDNATEIENKDISTSDINNGSKIVSEIKQLYSPTYTPPVLRSKPSWVHIFPEGYVCQLEPPHNNSMRFFRWGAARLILEPTVAPIVVPIFSNGFEKIVPEGITEDLFDRISPQNFGEQILVNIGKAIDDKIIEGFRNEWRELCNKFYSKANPNDLTFDLKFGDEAGKLRSKVAAYLREKVAELRLENGFPEEDQRFKEIPFWKKYTGSEGESDPDIKFVGQNWAIKNLQTNIPSYDKYGNVIEEPATK